MSTVAAGNAHSCAVASGGPGTGLNNYGQLGDGSTMMRLTPVGVAGLGSGTTTNRTTPVNVVELDFGVVALGEENGAHICVRMDITSGGSVKYRGFNGHGDLGNRSTSTSLTPVSMTGF